MRAPGFWWKSRGPVAALLAPVGAIYGIVAAARMQRAGERAGVPVVCIGNPTLGGAGKTPTALALAQLLKALGERPFFISRGYGGRARGPVRVDVQRHDARAVGDEPLLLARAFPTVVARDRVAGAKLAEQEGASVVVLDDGFQNPALEKDLALLVVDGMSGVGNGRVFPAGPLRAPLGPQLERAQGIVIVGAGAAGATVAEIAAGMGIAALGARLMPDPAVAAKLSRKSVLAFAGIGHPEKFFATLAETGAEIIDRRVFADHHFYSAGDAAALLAIVRARGLLPVTTEKDQARMAGDPALAELASVTRALPVRLVFEDEAAVRALLQRALTRARG
ncbi:MAG: tetraacyldisaccharide 4'-kinase [Xanthobacteraceae bacterium]|nr:tetraacyldisaccharide 4'-kinase [Xanthobacteraceae bacterium]